MPDDDVQPAPDADNEPQLLSEEDLAAVFAQATEGQAASPPSPPPTPRPAAAEPPLSLGGPAEDEDEDTALQLDQASIDALFSGGMPAAPAKPKAAKLPTPANAPAAPPPTRERAPVRTKATQVGDLDLLADVILAVSAEIGRTEMTIQEVLKLRPGSIIELDKLAGEPVELYVNDRCIARGEVVVVDDSFGIRITDLGDA